MVWGRHWHVFHCLIKIRPESLIISRPAERLSFSWNIYFMQTDAILEQHWPSNVTGWEKCTVVPGLEPWTFGLQFWYPVYTDWAIRLQLSHFPLLNWDLSGIFKSSPGRLRDLFSYYYMQIGAVLEPQMSVGKEIYSRTWAWTQDLRLFIPILYRLGYLNATVTYRNYSTKEQ